ncbi:MAG: hypothetical protein MJ252_20135 [archaeon]|nr:hypothetical protein [archaeon]
MEHKEIKTKLTKVFTQAEIHTHNTDKHCTLRKKKVATYVSGSRIKNLLIKKDMKCLIDITKLKIANEHINLFQTSENFLDAAKFFLENGSNDYKLFGIQSTLDTVNNPQINGRFDLNLFYMLASVLFNDNQQDYNFTNQSIYAILQIFKRWIQTDFDLISPYLIGDDQTFLVNADKALMDVNIFIENKIEYFTVLSLSASNKKQISLLKPIAEKAAQFLLNNQLLYDAQFYFVICGMERILQKVAEAYSNEIDEEDEEEQGQGQGQVGNPTQNELLFFKDLIPEVLNKYKNYANNFSALSKKKITTQEEMDSYASMKEIIEGILGFISSANVLNGFYSEILYGGGFISTSDSLICLFVDEIIKSDLQKKNIQIGQNLILNFNPNTEMYNSLRHLVEIYINMLFYEVGNLEDYLPFLGQIIFYLDKSLMNGIELEEDFFKDLTTFFRNFYCEDDQFKKTLIDCDMMKYIMEMSKLKEDKTLVLGFIYLLLMNIFPDEYFMALAKKYELTQFFISTAPCVKTRDTIMYFVNAIFFYVSLVKNSPKTSFMNKCFDDFSVSNICDNLDRIQILVDRLWGNNTTGYLEITETIRSVKEELNPENALFFGSWERSPTEEEEGNESDVDEAGTSSRLFDTGEEEERRRVYDHGSVSDFYSGLSTMNNTGTSLRNAQAEEEEIDTRSHHNSNNNSNSNSANNSRINNALNTNALGSVNVGFMNNSNQMNNFSEGMNGTMEQNQNQNFMQPPNQNMNFPEISPAALESNIPPQNPFMLNPNNNEGQSMPVQNPFTFGIQNENPFRINQGNNSFGYQNQNNFGGDQSNNIFMNYQNNNNAFGGNQNQNEGYGDRAHTPEFGVNRNGTGNGNGFNNNQNFNC